jgi:acetyl esterase/lipase
VSSAVRLAPCIAVALLGAPTAAAGETSKLPIREFSRAHARVGTAAMRVTIGAASATATVRAPRVRLSGRGPFILVTCVRAYAVTRSHANVCRETASAHRRVAVAPTATATLARPPAGGRAWFAYEVSVFERRGVEGYAAVAGSWPRRDANAASVAVPAPGARVGRRPIMLGAPLGSGRRGGVNTGQPDSFCAPAVLPLRGPPEPGVRATGLGPNAPAYYEIGEPTGRFAGQPPKGVMLIIHGGSWFLVGPGAVAGMRADADRWRARGWRTLNLDYRACATSLLDTRWFYDAARARWGTALPYCALGTSAGGHLALALALTRPGLFCLIDRAGPPDPLALPDERTVPTGRDGARRAYNWMVAAFGPDALGWWYPPLSAPPFASTRILYASAANDVYVPAAQGRALRAKVLAADPRAYVDVVRLRAGAVPFVHANVAERSLLRYEERERRLVAPLG